MVLFDEEADFPSPGQPNLEKILVYVDISV